MPSVISAESPGTMNRDTSPGRSWALRSRLTVARASGPVLRDLLEDPLGAGVELVVGHDLADQAHRARRVAASISAAVKKR